MDSQHPSSRDPSSQHPGSRHPSSDEPTAPEVSIRAGAGPVGSDVIGSAAPSRRLGRRSTAVAAGAVVLVAGGGAAAWAASTSPTPSPSGSAAPSYGAPGYGTARPGTSGVGPEGEVRHGPGGREGFGTRLGGRALHGELTVPDGAEAYKQVLVQRGAVTAVSATSLAVKSADGYTHTYVLNGDTVVDGKKGDTSTLAVGDTVGVLADADSTATRVVEPRVRALAGEGTPGTEASPGVIGPNGTPRRHRPPGTTPATPGETTPGTPTPGADAEVAPAPAPASTT